MMVDANGDRLVIGARYHAAGWWGGIVTYRGPYKINAGPENRMPVVTAEWASARWFTVGASSLTPETL